MNDNLSVEASRLVRNPEELQYRIVFEESCTGGLVAAALVEVPGVSRYLCGTAAVYRDETKTAWLGIPPEILQEHGAVCSETTVQMVVRVLCKTPEADLAAAVTGYLGPDAPPDDEGLVYVAVSPISTVAPFLETALKRTN
jgi:PncC family amidohydrolase